MSTLVVCGDVPGAVHHEDLRPGQQVAPQSGLRLAECRPPRNAAHCPLATGEELFTSQQQRRLLLACRHLLL